MCVFCGPRVNFSGGCLHLQIQILRLTKAVAGLHGFPPQRRVPEVTTGRGVCAGRGQDHGTKGTPWAPWTGSVLGGLGSPGGDAGRALPRSLSAPYSRSWGSRSPAPLHHAQDPT